jgi:hypothetical protein
VGAQLQGGVQFVSIQLVSPASGEAAQDAIRGANQGGPVCFHSISFPSEWGEFAAEPISPKGFRHQIDVPSFPSYQNRQNLSNNQLQIQSWQGIDAR